MLTFAIGAAAAAAVTYAGFASMSPTSQLYGHTFIGEPTPSSRIFLTYDDGPNDPYTQQLLDLFAAANAKATFFLIAKYVRQRPDIARAIVAAGHTIGNHTESHPNLAIVSAARMRRELDTCTKILEDTLGIRPKLFRPPFGGRRPSTLRFARERGMMPILWNVTSFDWNMPGTDRIYRNIAPKLRGGDVVLMHDGGHLAFGTDRSQTVECTKRLLADFGGRFAFSAVPTDPLR